MAATENQIYNLLSAFDDGVGGRMGTAVGKGCGD